MMREEIKDMTPHTQGNNDNNILTDAIDTIYELSQHYLTSEHHSAGYVNELFLVWAHSQKHPVTKDAITFSNVLGAQEFAVVAKNAGFSVSVVKQFSEESGDSWIVVEEAALRTDSWVGIRISEIANAALKSADLSIQEAKPEITESLECVNELRTMGIPWQDQIKIAHSEILETYEGLKLKEHFRQESFINFGWPNEQADAVFSLRRGFGGQMLSNALQNGAVEEGDHFRSNGKGIVVFDIKNAAPAPAIYVFDRDGAYISGKDFNTTWEVLRRESQIQPENSEYLSLTNYQGPIKVNTNHLIIANDYMSLSDTSSIDRQVGDNKVENQAKAPSHNSENSLGI